MDSMRKSPESTETQMYGNITIMSLIARGLKIKYFVCTRSLSRHSVFESDTKIVRRIETPQQGPFSDLLWSDPDYIDTWSLN